MQPTFALTSPSLPSKNFKSWKRREEDRTIDQSWVENDSLCFISFFFFFFGKPLASKQLHFCKSPQLRAKWNPPTNSINLHCGSCSSVRFLSPEDANSLSRSCKNTSSKNKHFGPFLFHITPYFSISFFAIFIVCIFSSVFKRILNPWKAKDSFLYFKSPGPAE